MHNGRPHTRPNFDGEDSRTPLSMITVVCRQKATIFVIYLNERPIIGSRRQDKELIAATQRNSVIIVAEFVLAPSPMQTAGGKGLRMFRTRPSCTKEIRLFVLRWRHRRRGVLLEWDCRASVPRGFRRKRVLGYQKWEKSG